jgi:MFS family permease
LTGFALLGLFWGAWGASVPAVQRHASADDGQLGIALLCVGTGALLAMRALGRLLDRSGPWLMPALAVSMALAGLVPALVTAPWQLWLVMLVVGACSGGFDVAINLEGVRTESQGPPVLALAHGSFSAAVLIGAPLAGVLRGLGAPLALVLGSASVVTVLGAAAMLRMSPAPPGEGSTEPPPPPWRASRPLLVLGGLLALSYFIEGAWQDWSSLHLERTLDASRGVGAAGPVCFAGAAVVGRVAAHRLAGRVPDRRLLAGGGVVAGIGTVIAATAGSVPLALLGIVIAGLGTSVCAPTIFRLGGRVVGAGVRGDAIGVITTLAYLGFLVGPAIIGGLAQAVSLPLALSFAAAGALVLALGARAV